MKPKVHFTCSACGASQHRWVGQCPECQAWNSLERSAPPSASGPLPRRGFSGLTSSEVTTFQNLDPTPKPRIVSHMPELDRVLGGGFVLGSVVLMGGDPGIGKSTLLLQATARLSEEHRCLYVTGEESLDQVSIRASRLHLDPPNLHLLADTDVIRIVEQARALQPQVMVVDSIQTLWWQQVSSAPGSVAQIRETASLLTQFAKQTQTVVCLVGHVTKEGQLAGPRLLEHMVDAVLYFEHQSDSRFRMIRATKNRFGTVNELGLFAMTDKGLRGVQHPSALFLSHRPRPLPGSSITVLWEGTRPLLLEVQALLDASHTGQARRITVGTDPQRLIMLLAVLHKHAGIATFDQDVFVNVVNGIRIQETAADLAVIASMISSLRNQPIPSRMIVLGEVGLSGEIRPVPYGQERLKEAEKHGFKQAIVPAANQPPAGSTSLQVHAVHHLNDAITALREHEADAPS